MTMCYGEAKDGECVTVQLPMPVTDCGMALSNQIAIGSVGITAGHMRFYPFPLDATQVTLPRASMTTLCRSTWVKAFACRRDEEELNIRELF